MERITYASEETGYTVAKVRIKGFLDPVTVVGNMIAPVPGEVLMVKGEWQTHEKFGRQFKVISYRKKVPATIDGIRKYLGSGLIKGIGPVMASRIVDKFGEKTLEVIEKRIDELEKVEGFGPKRIGMVAKAWQEQGEIRELMIFLQSHDVTAGHAVKIFKHYGQDSITLLTRNPYRLATDIFGIGFETADRIAGKLGFEKNAPIRAEAGLLYLLHQFAEQGHVFCPYETLIEKGREVLDIEGDVLAGAMANLEKENHIVVEDLNRDLEQFAPNYRAVYLAPYHVSETGLARHIGRLLGTPVKMRSIDTDKALSWVQNEINLELAAKQVEAVRRAVSDKIMVITGGPGTGKTTIIHAVRKIFSRIGARIMMAAPTGRASKRMSEATGYAAKTIHRMLEFSLQKGGFKRKQDNPLEVDVLILDEVSMIDTTLMYHLMKAVPSEAVLIMVGDVHQLPPVGAGSVLKDIIRSGVVPVVELSKIFRQAEQSQIIVNAHRLQKGLMPNLHSDKGELEDFYFLEQDDPETVLKMIKDLVCERIPRSFNLGPMQDIQVLSPMHKGVVGIENLNLELQRALNPSKIEVTRGEKSIRLQDRVMQIRNNYDKEVFNGDIGRVTAIDSENQEVSITFDGLKIAYDFQELDEIVLAYAVSVHKAQGSEYPAVILPVLPQHYIMLQRNLIYTAVTRGKRLVVIIGSKKALTMGVKNDRIMRRYTSLTERLMQSRLAS
ncbi:ATP-dependent RecD-like DNA helicase [Thermodesulfobacteriota bacterium]